MKILITGGAGFIGSALARQMAIQGHAVTIFDNLSPQVHGAGAVVPAELAAISRFVVGDVRDPTCFHAALEGQEVVVHLAAETGTGQSMYAVRQYDAVNNHGVAVLLDYVVNTRHSCVRKLVVASSRAIYGEGKYRCHAHGVVYPQARVAADLARGLYEPRCPVCEAFVSAVPTDEASRVHPSSFYGLTKYNQEASVLLFATQLGIAAYALRYQNVYGPGQSLVNPYTGILAIFSGLARNDDRINIFEDGLGSRDFVHVEDVVSATCACVEDDRADAVAMNIGSGAATTVLEVAQSVVDYFNSRSTIQVTGDFRLGDIRHNVADLQLASSRINYVPRHGFTSGIASFLGWAAAQRAQESLFTASMAELEGAGMLMRATR